MTHDDPRITAWALGEGTAGERAEVEALLASDPALRAEAEALRDAAGSLKAGLAAEPIPALDPAHRGALEAALSGAPKVSERSPRLLRVSPEFGAVAATLLLTLGLAIGGATGNVEFGGQRIEVDRRIEVNGMPEHGEFMRLTGSVGVRTGFTAGDSIGGGANVNGINGLGPGGGKGGVTGQNAACGSSDAPMLLVSNFGQETVTEIPPGAIQPNPSTAVRELFHRGGVGGAGGNITLPMTRALQTRLNALKNARAHYFTPAGGTLPPTVLALQEWNAATPATKLAQIDADDINLETSAGGGFSLPTADSSTESFSPIVENAYVRPLGEAALSTFSIDVDTAAYSVVRRCLVEQNRLPPPGALRIEELVNYFPYAYEGPFGSDPFAVHVDAASCPWNPAHRLVRIVLQGRRVEERERPDANLVFLLDVSGSMNQPNKLPLVKQSISLLADRLTARDRVGMVVYAGASGLALPSTPGDRRAEILAALERLQAGGSTNGAAGIEQAYQVATENFVRGGINRVVLATDGDFNVGVSDPSTLVKLVEDKAKSGVFLTALGYGMDNLKDSTLEQLADKGNGNYGYIDTVNEAKKVLVDQGMGTLHAIGKDVKIQVEFNPARVAAFRLLGYENRVLAAQDFADDRKDAGEIGAGHTVTAFYEVVPAGEAVPGAPVDELRYQRVGSDSVFVSGVALDRESLVVKLRWKEPEGEVSTLREVPFEDAGLAFDAADPDFRFGAAVAAFGMVLRDSEHKGDATLGLVREIASGALGDDPGGWRGEFLGLVDRAAALKR